MLKHTLSPYDIITSIMNLKARIEKITPKINQKNYTEVISDLFSDEGMRAGLRIFCAFGDKYHPSVEIVNCIDTLRIICSQQENEASLIQLDNTLYEDDFLILDGYNYLLKSQYKPVFKNMSGFVHHVDDKYYSPKTFKLYSEVSSGGADFCLDALQRRLKDIVNGNDARAFKDEEYQEIVSLMRDSRFKTGSVFSALQWGLSFKNENKGGYRSGRALDIASKILTYKPELHSESIAFFASYLPDDIIQNEL